jgi:predicted  nucleic acid-binding Zn-ribbon protein
MLPKNSDDELSRRMVAIEKELAALATAIGTVYELMSEIKVETKKEREINYQELRIWAQSNNSLLAMISSAIGAIDALKRKITQLPTSSTGQQKLSPNFQEILTNFGKDLREISHKTSQLSTTNQSQLTNLSQSISQHLSHLEQLKNGLVVGKKGGRYWIALGGGAILIIGSTWMTIANIMPIATKMGWTIEKLGRIEKKMGIKTASDYEIHIQRRK